MYANNNPYTYVDPNGEWAFLIPIIKSVATSALIGAVQGAITGGWQGALAGALSGAIDGVVSLGMNKVATVAKAANTGKAALATNPFKGKSFNQIDEMFKAKGFTTKGPNPLTGKGSYFNPKSGTRYYLDKGGMYKKGFEGPHVDIWYRKHTSLEKTKHFLDGSSKMYSPLR